MFANITLLTLKAGHTMTWTDPWLALIVQQPGFRGFLSSELLDDASHLVLITLWQSAEAAASWERNDVYRRLRDVEIAPSVADVVVMPTHVQGAILGFDGR
ncbi:MAG TPA: antibiotic biosynthesis monooxygenase [Thermomicrobiaceae bacterium]|nr:antibiotic biosynthesis monooxygenase [Thermomicrobiaceae bacterium]